MNQPPLDVDALRRAFAELAGAAEVPQLIVEVSRHDTRVLAANPAAETLLARDDLVGTNLVELTVETELPADQEAWAAVLAGDLDVIGRRRRYRRGDGGAVTVDALAFTIRKHETGVTILVVLAELARTDWMLRRMRHDIEVTNALSELRSGLLAGEDGKVLLRRICTSVADLLGATNVGVLRLDGPDHVRLAAILGPRLNPSRVRWPIIDDEFGRALRESRVTCFSIPASTRAAFRVGSDEPMQVAMAPLTTGTTHLGSLTVRRDSRPFTQEELSLLGIYADGASQALSLSDTRKGLISAHVREQIARDLHDEVIQDLVAVRLGLAALALEATDTGLDRKVGDLLDELDQVTKQLRDVVRGIAEAATAEGFRAAIESLTIRRAERAGMGWSVAVDEAVVSALTADERREFMSVVNEAVSNAARHSDGTQIDVSLGSIEGRAELTVCDDGVGPGPASRSGGRGLVNVRARADDLGGGCAVEELEPGGTRLVWWIPLDPAG